MIAYLDTSAVVPILISEPSTATCRRMWEDADARLSSRLTEVEVAAALAMAERLGRVSTQEHDDALANFSQIWGDVHVIDVSAEVASSAGVLARSLGLRAYDAVHCASAVAVESPDLVGVSGDVRLLASWRTVGMATVDTNQSSG